MTTKTRSFVLVSLLVLSLGVGTGLVAYYVGFAPTEGPDELRFVPANASLVAFADVRAVMVSEVRQKLLQVVPTGRQGQREFEEKTGINIETDIDRVLACLAPVQLNDQGPSIAGMVLARGRFNDVKIEGLMREHGGRVEEYKGKRLIIAGAAAGQGAKSLSLAFMEPGLVAIGSSEIVRAAIDLAGGGDTVTSNAEMMDFMKALDGNVWAVGRFDALTSQTQLPAPIASQIPPITWFSASGRVDGGISGAIRADARNEESANSLRDVVRGVLAFARLRAQSQPDLQPMIDSIQLGGVGNTITLSFDISPQMFDTLTTAIQGLRPGATVR